MRRCAGFRCLEHTRNTACSLAPFRNRVKAPCAIRSNPAIDGIPGKRGNERGSRGALPAGIDGERQQVGAERRSGFGSRHEEVPLRCRTISHCGADYPRGDPQGASPGPDAGVAGRPASARSGRGKRTGCGARRGRCLARTRGRAFERFPISLLFRRSLAAGQSERVSIRGFPGLVPVLPLSGASMNRVPIQTKSPAVLEQGALSKRPSWTTLPRCGTSVRGTTMATGKTVRGDPGFQTIEEICTHVRYAGPAEAAH